MVHTTKGYFSNFTYHLPSIYDVVMKLIPTSNSVLNELNPIQLRVMALSSVFLLFISLLLISSTTIQAFDPCSSSSSSEESDLTVLPIYSKCSPFSPSKHESLVDTVIDMAKKDPERVTYLSSLLSQKTKVPVSSGQVLNIGTYVVRAKIGTPGQLLYMVLDTSNDAAWVPCAGCTGCTSSTVFTPNMSSTYGSMDCKMTQCSQVRGGLSCMTAAEPSPCLFNQTYGGDSSFSATLSQDSLRLNLDIIPNYSFGCINAVSGKAVPPQGLLGLGRGPMSLLTQSGSLYSGVFSYCLPSFKSYYFSGSLKLGPMGQPKNTKFTPLLRSPHRPSLYYVNLTGISVSKVLVPVTPGVLNFDPITGSGTIIDSGTVITRFVEPVYTALRDEFRKQIQGPISSLGAFDTCFMATDQEVVPAVTLHFTDMDLILPTENTLIHSSSGSLACLAMAASPVNSMLNIIANLQQQNLRVLFDLTNSRVGISREVCN